MTCVKKKIEFRNTTGSGIPFNGGFTLGGSTTETIFDTNAFTQQILDDCCDVLDDPATTNEKVGDGSIVVVKDSVDLSVQAAFDEMQCIRQCMQKYLNNQEQHWISSGVNGGS